jgi:hypothetical protein
VSGFRVADATKGAGSTITNLHGVYIEDQTQGTNNYGITSLVSSGTNKWNIYASGTAANYFAGNVQFAAGTAAAPALTRFGDDNTGIFFPAADTIAFAEGGAEAMRITNAGNVGIGTSSPAVKLEVSGNSGLGSGTGSPIAIRIGDTSQDGGASTWNTTTDFTQLQFYSADASGPGGANIRYTVGAVMENTAGQTTALTFRSSSGGTLTERMRLDSSGNLGLGVTPSAWGSSIRSIDIGFGTALTNANSTTDTWLSSNAYYTTQWLYKNTQAASYYRQVSGAHSWFTAPSGTAGDAISFTQAMTLDAGGNLLVGTTTGSGTGRLRVVDSVRIANSSSETNALLITTTASTATIETRYGTPLVFGTNAIERARITTGAVLVGLTSATGVAQLQVSGPIRTTGYTVATLPAGTVGMRTYVTDALAPSFGVAVAGSGAVTIPVFYDGANWIVA